MVKYYIPIGAFTSFHLGNIILPNGGISMDDATLAVVIGDNIRKYRERANLTQGQLAEQDVYKRQVKG